MYINSHTDCAIASNLLELASLELSHSSSVQGLLHSCGLESRYAPSLIFFCISQACISRAISCVGQIRLRLLSDLHHTSNQSHKHGAFVRHPQQLRRSTPQGPVLPEYLPPDTTSTQQWLLSAKGQLGSGARTPQAGHADWRVQ